MMLKAQILAPTDPIEALSLAEKAAADTKVPVEAFDAQLALASIESIRSESSGRARINAVLKEAEAKGYAAVASRARRSLSAARTVASQGSLD